MRALLVGGDHDGKLMVISHVEFTTGKIRNGDHIYQISGSLTNTFGHVKLMAHAEDMDANGAADHLIEVYRKAVKP